MHHAISYQLAEARIADLRRQAHHDAIAREARLARRARHKDGTTLPARRPAGGLVRRLRTALAARGG